MASPPTDALAAYTRFDFTDPEGRWTRPVFRRGRGPAVIVIHEMPGLHPVVLRFADRVAAAGMTVFCPSLFGEPGRPVGVGYTSASVLSTLCVRREFDAWAHDRSSPILDWLRALAKHAHGECGGKGVGAVGMCFTGNFALAMMTEPAVVAPVLSQPSLPLGPSKKARAALGVSPAEIACAKRRFAEEDLSMVALRFVGDPLVSASRFVTLKQTFGDRVETIELAREDAKQEFPYLPHAVLTVHLREDGPSKAAEQRVLTFLAQRTGAEARRDNVELT